MICSGLSLGLGRVGLGADMADTELSAGVAEVERLVATAIVGHHTRQGDAEACLVDDGSPEERDRALLLLVGHDLD